MDINIITREGKGARLTQQELDGNFQQLADALAELSGKPGGFSLVPVVGETRNLTTDANGEEHHEPSLRLMIQDGWDTVQAMQAQGYTPYLELLRWRSRGKAREFLGREADGRPILGGFIPRPAKWVFEARPDISGRTNRIEIQGREQLYDFGVRNWVRTTLTNRIRSTQNSPYLGGVYIQKISFRISFQNQDVRLETGVILHSFLIAERFDETIKIGGIMTPHTYYGYRFKG